jgi:hypothetical protein
MENTAPSRSHQSSADITGSADRLAEFIRSTWKSLRSTPLMVWMQQPMRLEPVTRRMASMPKSATSLPPRSISVGPILISVSKAPRPTAQPVKPMPQPRAPIRPMPEARKTARPALDRVRMLLPTAEWIRRPLQGRSATELVDLARRHECPQCHGIKFRRSRPRSVEWVLCLARVFPYRCYSCNRRFFGLSLDRDLAGHRRETNSSLWYNH